MDGTEGNYAKQNKSEENSRRFHSHVEYKQNKGTDPTKLKTNSRNLTAELGFRGGGDR